MLELKNVYGGYGRITILNGVSFTIPKASITTVIGPNGAGKSTVFKAIFGLLNIHSGKILLDGKDVTGETPGGDDRAMASPTCRRGAMSCRSCRSTTTWNWAASPRRTRPRCASASRRSWTSSRCCGSARDRKAIELSGGQQKQLGDRPRAAARSEADPDRRALDRPFAEPRAGGVQDADPAARSGRHHPDGGAERQGGARHVRLRPGSGARPDAHARRGRQSCLPIRAWASSSSAATSRTRPEISPQIKTKRSGLRRASRLRLFCFSDVALHAEASPKSPNAVQPPSTGSTTPVMPEAASEARNATAAATS